MKHLLPILEKNLGLEPGSLKVLGAVTGGSINQAFRVGNSQGTMLFVKTHHQPPVGFYQREAEGLAALATVMAHGGPAIPKVVMVDPAGQFLAMEYLEPDHKNPDYLAFGRALAAMHQETSSLWGWSTPNYLGTSVQPNTWGGDWWDFFGTYRLGVQLTKAHESKLLTTEDLVAGDRLRQKLPALFGGSEGVPALVHGDLWAGNHLFSQGRAYLIDPAVYFGARETDLAMTELFGGYPPEFYRAYQEAWPLPQGYTERREIYNLYHLLNHLNLFGVSYRESCRQIIGRFG